MLDFETLSIIVFILAIVVLAIADRKNIKYKSGLLTRRTKKGRKWIYGVAKKHFKLLSRLAKISAIIGVVTSILMFSLLFFFVYRIFSSPEKVIEEGAPVRLILPQIGKVRYPGFIFGIPFWYWMISIFVVVSVHESFHALIARLKNIKIKSFGLGLLVIFPMAFVEPDEKQIKKLDPVSKIKIYSAGTFGNFLTALVMLIITLSFLQLTSYMLSPAGVEFNHTLPDTPAHQANLEGTIIAVNNQSVRNVEEFVKIMETIEPNETMTITSTKNTYVFKTATHPENSTKAFIGVYSLSTDFVFSGVFEGYGKPTGEFLYSYFWVLGLFFWLFVINLGVGAINLLPLKPLDGGLIFNEILNKYTSKKIANRLIIYLSLITLFMLIMAIFGPSLLSMLVK